MALDTRQSLLKSAEYMLRSKGYAAFSFADLEKMVGIRKASIHHHFPTKEDLGVVIVESYIANTMQDLANIEATHSEARDRLDAYAGLFQAIMESKTLPLCGALAAEMVVMPEKLQALTKKYFEIQLNWIERIISEGDAKGQLSSGLSSKQRAYQILSLLEGASFVSWAVGNDNNLNPSIIGLIIGAE